MNKRKVKRTFGWILSSILGVGVFIGFAALTTWWSPFVVIGTVVAVIGITRLLEWLFED